MTKGRITMFRLHKCLVALVAAVCLISLATPSFAQLTGTETRYIRVGSLQSKFTSIGAERAWNGSYYEGLTWPSDYPYTDNAVIERTYIGCQDFTNSVGANWANYCVGFNSAYPGISVFPMVLKETAKFGNPGIFVDGVDVSAPYASDVDSVDPNQVPDRIITNVVNTSMGITMTRRILAFSQQYHDNYFIIEYTFKNTGYIDYTNVKKLNETIHGFRFGTLDRYSVCREGADNSGYDQEYGKHSWVTRRGEDYAQHVGDLASLTEASGIPDWLRAGFEWYGQRDEDKYDNIGAPDGPFTGSGTGRLCSPQFAGIVTLHVDKTATDTSDNPSQPCVLGWHAGDTVPSLGDMSPSTAPQQADMYSFLSGIPYKGLGNDTERMYEDWHLKYDDPWKVHGDGGGTGLWICYGPWDLAPGDSVNIVIAEGVNGLSRDACWQIGRRYWAAYQNSSDKGPFTLPNGSTTTDLNVYKDTWVYTGMDSIMETFSRAVRNYDSGFNIPEPPEPPPVFNVNSGGDRISLSWQLSPSEGSPGFAGYKIFRAVATPDTDFDLIATLPPGTDHYDDLTPQRGFSYYYYISAYNDGNNNTSDVTNPTGSLMSSRFYTKTDIAAYLQRQAGSSLSGIRIVPNPYNIRSAQLQYPGEPDKIMFLNIPGHCIIRIYTENGNLIKTIVHDNGSGDETWNSNTSSNQVVVSGVYIVQFSVTQDYNDPTTGKVLYHKGDTAYQKCIIIR